MLNHLPDCNTNIVRDFLSSKGWKAIPSLSTDQWEYWTDGKYGLTYFSKQEKLTCSDVVLSVELAGFLITDVPYYKQVFAPNYPGY